MYSYGLFLYQTTLSKLLCYRRRNGSLNIPYDKHAVCNFKNEVELRNSCR
jgi:hypothetical protein